MSIAITTRSYDNTRSGANTQETALTPSAIRAHGVKRLFTLSLPGDARGCEAQPLIVPRVKFADGSMHDVVYIATMANRVFAFDAHSGIQLWMVQLGTPIKSNTQIDQHLVNDHWGIVSTPVIDLQAGLIYACAWTSPDGTPQSGQHCLHALRLADGSAAHQPVNLEAVTSNPGHGLPVRRFRSAQRKQRAALLLHHGTVFVAFDAVAESAGTTGGWLIAVDTGRFQVTAAWTSTSLGSGGGIGHSGGGPAADVEGNIYVLTGSGDFDAVTDFGSSMVKLRYTPPRANGVASITAVDWWTPSIDNGHTSGNGSAGPVLAPTIGAVLAANNNGMLYMGNMHSLGQTRPTDLAPINTSSNYAKLKTPPIFYTYYSGPRSLTHHLHGTPVLWKSAHHGLLHFCWGENGNLRAWGLAQSGLSTYLGCGAEVASGMPGGMISLSADGDTDGVVWASVPYTDANTGVSAGRFLAYDAANIGKYSDGSGAIVRLWDSQDWNWRFSHNKFNRPVVWNGRVFLPTYDGSVWVLGLA